MYETQPAVAALNKVPGFNPLNFMRKTVLKGTNKEILYLDLKFKKLWFRLAYPKGHIKKNVLKITEQIAVIEVQIFLNTTDTEPVASFIAQRNADEKMRSLYIQDAQYAAENQALTDAGFGAQFVDVSQGNDPEIYDIKTAANTVSADIKNTAAPENKKPQQTNETPMQKAVEKPPAAPQKKEELPAPQPEKPATVTAANISAAQPQKEIPEQAETPPEQKTTEPAPQTEKPVIAASAETAAAQETKIEDQPAESNEPAMVEIDSPDISEENEIEQIETGQPQDDITQHLSYTADMPVEEILKVMTLGEAGLVVVDTGVCKGSIMSDVMEKRPGSLKWYITGYTGNNNIMKAAAKMMLDYYNEQKNKAA